MTRKNPLPDAPAVIIDLTKEQKLYTMVCLKPFILNGNLVRRKKKVHLDAENTKILYTQGFVEFYDFTEYMHDIEMYSIRAKIYGEEKARRMTRSVSGLSRITRPKRTISKRVRYEVCHRQHWKCARCGVRLKFTKSSPWEGEVAHIDHKFPYSRLLEYSKGVKNIHASENLQALCPTCNLKKGKRRYDV